MNEAGFVFCYGQRDAGCNFVRLREKILNVSQWIHLRFFRSPSSFRLASRRPRYEATFETSSNSRCLESWYFLDRAADAAGLVLGKKCENVWH
jgi:hypothetical protein